MARCGFNQPKTVVATATWSRLLFGMIAAITLFLSTPAVRAVEGYDGYSRGSSSETPESLQEVGIEEHLGAQIDKNLEFYNEAGEKVTIGSLLANGKPILLSPIYYSCPGLCNFHLNGLNDAFKELKEPLGVEFDHVLMSIDPAEGSALAQEKKESYLKAYGRPEGAKGWHFLTGSAESITKLTEQIGFKYRWDEKEKQWAHAATAVVITPEGKISRYLYGIIFDPKVVRLSMVEASNGTIGTVVDKLILFCFHFDPKASKYTFYAFNVMRAGAISIVIILAAFLVPFWLRSRKELQGEA